MERNLISKGEDTLKDVTIGSSNLYSFHVSGRPLDPTTTNTATAESDSTLGKDTKSILQYFTGPKFCTYALRCAVKPNGTTKVPLTWTERDEVVAYCQALKRTIGVSSKLLISHKIKDTLLSLQNKHEKRQFRFPAEVVAAARETYDQLELNGWGASVAKHKCSEDQLSPGPSNHRATTQQKSPSRTLTDKRHNSSSQKFGATAYPPRSHPIWGDDGIMRGLYVKLDGKKKAATFKPDCLKRDAKVYGHNGIQVGQWWPRQRCAVRDGAHGHHMAGISQSDTGVCSIVVSSAYEESDFDDGDVIWYSSPSCTENRNADAFLTKTVKAIEAMDSSFASEYDIRVLRSSGAGWSGRPTVGIRYDGLYRIVDSETNTNEKGGIYKRWKLERRSGQPSLAAIRTRPTSQEQAEYGRISDYY